MDLFSQTDQSSSPEDFLVSRSQLPAHERARKILDISGQKCIELSEKSARTTLLGRMCLDYLVSKGEWYLNRCAMTWKAKATKSRRLYFQLVPQVHRTEGIESGLLLTPTTREEVQDLDRFQDRMEKYPNGTKMPNLATQMQGFLITPSTMDIAPSKERFQKRTDYRASIGRKYVPGSLTEQVSIMMQGLLPTTTKRDWKGGRKLETLKESGRNHTNSLNDYLTTTGTTGHLSHHFTLDMMGFPPTWCDISEPVLQRLDKHLSRLKRTSEKNPTGSGKKPSNVLETP